MDVPTIGLRPRDGGRTCARFSQPPHDPFDHRGLRPNQGAGRTCGGWLFIWAPLVLVWPGLLGDEPAGAQYPPENEPPVFIEGAETARQLAENTGGGQDIGAAVGATDADGHRLTYRLGGADVDSFTLDVRTGQLRTRDGVDYDHETSARHAVTVRAEDGRGGSAEIAVIIMVTNEAEPPSAPDRPTVWATARNELTLRWTTPANPGPELRDYEGQYRAEGDADWKLGWERVGVVSEITMGGLDADTRYEMQVRARNADGVSEWSEAVDARTESNRAPVFAEGTATSRQLDENTGAGVDVGQPVAATDAEGDRLVYSLEGSDAGAFEINSSSGQVVTRTGEVYDYETKTEYMVTVRVDDGHEGAATSAVRVAVQDLDDAPIVADAGWDLTVVAGGTALLQGSARVSGASSGNDDPTYSWSFVSWPGDSAPALDDDAIAAPSFVAAAEGDYVLRLTASHGTDSDMDDVTVTAKPSTTETASLLVADLLVDANRDGVVDAADEDGEDVWDAASGAVFGGNMDDDDGDRVRDGWDDRANGRVDLLDMAPVVARRIPGLQRQHSVSVEMTYVSTSTRPKPRLFYERADAGIELLIASGETRGELPLARLAATDMQLYLESPLGRDVGFDGQLSLTLKVEEDGTAVSEDVVALRGSPIVYSHHLQAAERVFVTALGSSWGRHNNIALQDALASRLRPSTALYRLDSGRYDGDHWVQDSMQTGYTERASTAGSSAALAHTQLLRGRPLQDFLPDEYLSASAGYAFPGGTSRSGWNYGGNVEVLPPYTRHGKSWPLGRVVVGSGMTDGQVDFFDAQGVQGPALEVRTYWLVVGHVDEIFSVVPNRNAGPGEKPWVIVIASTDLAIASLEKAVEDGHGSVPIFAGRGRDETSAEEILADDFLMDANESAQRDIDQARRLLTWEMGLTEADFREVPALFYWDGARYPVSAYMPAMQNLLVANDVLLIPDPEGPEIGGVDIWQQGMLDALDGLGLTAHFVDVYYSYHTLLGAIHCGTNVERAGAEPWWSLPQAGGSR